MARINVRIRQARLDYQQRVGKDVSIAEVAKAIHISRSALSSIETGRTEPKMQTLADLCKFYGVQVSDLLEYVDEDRHSRRIASPRQGTIRRLLATSEDCWKQP